MEEKDEVDEIKQVYRDWFSKLFEKREAVTEAEKKSEEKVKQKMIEILNRAESQKEMTLTGGIIEKVIKTLKRRKACDRKIWNGIGRSRGND